MVNFCQELAATTIYQLQKGITIVPVVSRTSSFFLLFLFKRFRASRGNPKASGTGEPPCGHLLRKILDVGFGVPYTLNHKSTYPKPYFSCSCTDLLMSLICLWPCLIVQGWIGGFGGRVSSGSHYSENTPSLLPR